MQVDLIPSLQAAMGKPGALRIAGPPARPQSQTAAGGSQPSSQQQRQEEADADLASQLQAQLNAQQARGGSAGRCGNVSDSPPNRARLINCMCASASHSPPTVANSNKLENIGCTLIDCSRSHLFQMSLPSA